MKKLKTILLVLLATISMASQAQIARHVEWRAEIEQISATEGALLLHATVEDGWHMYGLTMPDVGDAAGVPDPTTIDIDNVPGLLVDGNTTCSVEPQMHFDSFMELNLPWLMGNFTLKKTFKLDGISGARIAGSVSFMTCSDESCTPPDRFNFDLNFGDVSTAPVTNEVSPEISTPTASISTLGNSDWWQPVDVETESQEQSYWTILLLGFLGGLVALMTPCVWPMIPMTVSFFLKKNKDRRKSIVDAVVYSLSIVVIFVVLGILLTLLFGPGKLNEIATSAVFNLIFFALLVFFAISFFGAFDITLPSSWSNAIDNRAGNTTGFLSIFFMAFTLVLVSFSCTGPIIGTLLVEAFSQSNLMGPLLGMGGFAIGLALPFGLFAFFPSMLKELPSSGSWLNTVKVVLGFIELILSLKFLSVADLAYGWRILDREVFIAIWIVLFVLLGVYLLGKLRFSHDGESTHTPVGRFFLAVASFSFAVYLLPGMWGAPLKAISAFAPPLYTQDFNLYGGEFREYHDYDEGMAVAASEGKPVLLDFSGYACVNCRKMEGAVFDTPEVRANIEQNYVMIVLMVDDKTPLPQPITVEEEGRPITLRTVGDKWSYLERYKFGTNQQPFYVLLDNDGKALNAPRAYDENVGAFVGWLEDGTEQYKNR